MAHEKKHFYKKDSPGHRRAVAGTTLTQIKKMLRGSSNKTLDRRRLHEQGLLGKWGGP